jgi:hypothetical protein
MAPDRVLATPRILDIKGFINTEQDRTEGNPMNLGHQMGTINKKNFPHKDREGSI